MQANNQVLMHLPKSGFLLVSWMLTACAASSTQQPSSVQASMAQAPTASVAIASPKPSPSADPVKISGAVDLDGIEPALIAKQAKLNIQFKTQSSQDCSLVMQYPQVSGLADTVVQAQLNTKLRKEMMGKMGAPEVMLAGDRCKKVSRKPGKLHTSTAHCEVHFAEESLVSVSCLNLTMPGAHPNPKVHSVTFDLVTGTIYQFTDLFKPGSNYVVRLAVIMRDAWWESGKPIDFPFEEVETGTSFDFYFQDRCDEVFQPYWERSRWAYPPKVCMVINNLGFGSSRNYQMLTHLDDVKDKLDTSGALRVLLRKIN